MNPFDLPGPQFLLFFAGVGAVVALALRWMRQQREAGSSTPQRVDDPYLLAVLRGGADEAVRVALLSLLDRGLVEANAADQIDRAKGVTPKQVQRDIEKAILESLDQPHLVYAILTGVRDKRVMVEYKNELLRRGLLPDADVQSQRLKLWLVGLVLLFATAGIKVGIGIARGRPVAFLVIEAGVFAVVTAAVCFPRRTASGDRLVASMKELFASLKNRAGSLRPGGATNELAWLGGVFGLAAVPSLIFPFQHVLLPKNRPGDHTSSTSCGSSCGSSASSGGGSSCGGGGCGGGCGGCGGG